MSNIRVKSIKLKLNKEAIEKLNKAKYSAAELTAEAILSDIVSRGVAPKDTGELEQSGYVEKSKGMIFNIIFNTPYARRWYFNLPFVDKNGVKHQPVTFKRDTSIDHWMDYYLDGKGKEWVVETYMKFFKQEAGGIIK